MPIQTAIDSINNNQGSPFGFKNRIINGAMVIDQRNAGSATTTSGNYGPDRFYFNNVTDASLSFQQSTDVPVGQGFSYSARITTTSADATIGASQYANLQTSIEGYNFADLGFGSGGASNVTLSFWVKATNTGNYSVALYNSAENRNNPQQFTVNASNTWEKKVITYVGDTTGTWLTTNNKGANLTFYYALGSNFLGSSGWNSGSVFGVTGQSNALSTNGNIFAITGVQLEKGSIATPFDFRPYTTELQLCQRYFEKSYDVGTAVGTAVTNGMIHQSGSSDSGNNLSLTIKFSVTKRTQPTMTAYRATPAASGVWDYFRSGASGTATVNFYDIGENEARIAVSTGASWVVGGVYGQWTASAEL